MAIKDRSVLADHGSAVDGDADPIEELDISKLVRAICEKCLSVRKSGGDDSPQDRDPCAICGGHRYYLWDPKTHGCYNLSGEPLRVLLDTGRLVDVYRTPKKRDSTAAVTALLDTLGKWVNGDQRRHFKLWFEDGWNCRAWPNHHRSKAYSANDSDLVNCLSECIRKIEGNIAEECKSLPRG